MDTLTPKKLSRTNSKFCLLDTSVMLTRPNNNQIIFTRRNLEMISRCLGSISSNMELRKSWWPRQFHLGSPVSSAFLRRYRWNKSLAIRVDK